jgi:hypothetical protein
MERRYVRQVLNAVGGNKTHAARILGIDRRSLYRRLEEPRHDPSKPAEHASGSRPIPTQPIGNNSNAANNGGASAAPPSSPATSNGHTTVPPVAGASQPGEVEQS